MGTSERVEGQASLHKAGGPTGYKCLATTRWHKIAGHSMFNNGKSLHTTTQLYKTVFASVP